MKCDLHTHSTYSDGTDTPEQIVKAAKEKGLIVALTDHNTTAGLDEFAEAGEKYGVTVINGIEFSTVWRNVELHILGLFIEPDQFGKIESMLKCYRVYKEVSNMELCERLRAAGYDIEYELIKAYQPNGNVNRAHIAAELVARGCVNSINQAFEELLYEGGPFYVPPTRLGAIETVKFLKKIGAVPVIAHPLKELNEIKLREFLAEAVDKGLVGMEIMHSSYDDEKRALAERIVKEYPILPSGGSDYHGDKKPDVCLGSGIKNNVDVPLSYYEAMVLYKNSAV